MPASSRWNRLLTIGGPIFVAIGAAAMLAWAVARENDLQRADAAQAAQREALTLAIALTEHVQRSFEQADVVAKLLADRVATRGFDLDLAQMTRVGILPKDVFVQIGITDAKGMLRASTVDEFRPIDLSDRAHIRVHLADPAHGPYISKPLLGRVSGRWSLQYSRAILNESGVLRGVVIVSIDPSYFSDLHQRIDVGEHGAINLIGTEDRIVRTQRAGTAFSAGQELDSDDALLRALRNARRGGFERTGPDGRAQWAGYDSLSKYPLALTVAFDRDEYLARTEAARARLQGAATMLALLFLTIGAAMSIAIARAKRAEAGAAQAREQAAALTERFDIAIAATPTGVLIVDPQHRITGLNDAACALTGFNEAELRDNQVQTLLERWCDAQQFDARASADDLFARQSGAAEQRIVLVRSAAPERRVEIRSHAFSRSGGHLLVVRDLTHAHLFDRTQASMVAAATHELRGPMARVEGLVDLLSNGAPSPRRRQELTELLRRELRRLQRIFDDLSDIAILEIEGARHLHFERFDLRDLRADFANATLGAPLIECAIDEAPIMVRGDRAQLARAIERLAEHAAGDMADVRIRVDLRLDADHALARLLVRAHDGAQAAQTDDAPLPRLRRSSSPNAAQPGGVGLWLALSIIELHDGQAFQHGTASSTVTSATLPICPPM